MQQRVTNIADEICSELESLKEEFIDSGEVIQAIEEKTRLLTDRLLNNKGPLLVAICGPTGAGKSYIVNSLAGGLVSPSSYRRPSTNAPVAVGPKDLLAKLALAFLPLYERVDAQKGIFFSNHTPSNTTLEHKNSENRKLYLSPLKEAPWDWPSELLLIDTPDFDSVILQNQTQAEDMAERADALILVVHQAKYADQSAWDFLNKHLFSSKTKLKRPLFIILNRLSEQAALDDFKARLKSSGSAAPLFPWPEENAEGQTLNAAKNELIPWLSNLASTAPELLAQNGLAVWSSLSHLFYDNLLPHIKEKQLFFETSFSACVEITNQWMEKPSDRLASSLPKESREKIEKALNELVSRSDLWAKPRRWLALPFQAASSGFKRIFGQSNFNEKVEGKLANSLAEAGREALVAAVRGEARALANAAALPSPQAKLDLTPDEIRNTYQHMIESRDLWLKEEIDKLLKGLPLGKKTAFYFIQGVHLLVIGSLLVQAGGLPGTETLLSGALGPLISKIAGVIISKETLEEFEVELNKRHHSDLAEIFERQGLRYQEYLREKIANLEPSLQLEEKFIFIENEAKKIWP